MPHSGEALALVQSAVQEDGSGNAYVDGNLGLGVTPTIAYTGARGVQMLSGGPSVYGTTNNLGVLGVNISISSAGVAKYQATGFSTRYQQQNGVHTFQSAASGTAGATISYSTSLTLDANGNVYGTAGTTAMTNGFVYIPSAGGAPTGVPTAVSGHVPMYYDSTGNNFYVYNGAWKKVALA